MKNGEIELDKVKHDQIRFKSNLCEIKKENNKRRSKEQNNALYNVDMLYKVRNEAIKSFNDYTSMVSEAKNKPMNKTSGKGLKILTPKQLLQRLPIALAQVKAGNNSENFINEIRKIAYSLYQSKEITKKVYNNILSPCNCKMDTIFMNKKNSKSSAPYDLILKLTDKLYLRISEKTIALSNLSIDYTQKNIKS